MYFWATSTNISIKSEGEHRCWGTMTSHSNTFLENTKAQERHGEPGGRIMISRMTDVGLQLAEPPSKGLVLCWGSSTGCQRGPRGTLQEVALFPTCSHPKHHTQGSGCELGCRLWEKVLPAAELMKGRKLLTACAPSARTQSASLGAQAAPISSWALALRLGLQAFLPWRTSLVFL